MPLKLGDKNGSLFEHNRDYDEGLNQRGIRPGQATIVVALDGSGDAESIQEGIDMLPTDGGVVYIKEGNYNLTTPILVNSDHIELNGAGSSTIIAVLSSVDSLDMSGANECVITNIKFNATGGGNKPINNLNGNSNKIINCWFDGFGASGIRIIDGSNNIISNNHFSNMANAIIIDRASGNIISNNNCADNTLLNFSNVSGTNASADDNIITNNISANSAVGTSVLVINDVVNRTIISGNILRGSTGTAGTNGYGIYIGANADRTLIGNNILNGNNRGGISDNGTNTLSADNIVA